MRRSEATTDRRPSREGSLGRRVGRKKASQAAQQFADDNPTGMILTRAQIQRKMRERSRTAALKLAEEQDKEREQRQAVAARKSAAKALATQARADNALRSRRRLPCDDGRDRSDGRRLGVKKSGADGGSNGNPPHRSSSLIGAYTRGRGPGAPVADGGVASTQATPGRRSTPLNAVQTCRREEDVRDDVMAGVTKDRAPSSEAAAGPRSALAQSHQKEIQRDDRARAALVDGYGSGSGGWRRMRESQSESRSPGSRARATIPSSSRTAAASARNSEPPLPTLRRRVVAGATGATVAAAARRDQHPIKRARTISSGARLAPDASAAIRGPRGRVDGNPSLKTSSTLSSQEGKQDDGEEARQRERDEQYEREHKKTLAYMARQRKLALLEKRKMKEEKAQKAENLRRALEKLDQARRQSMSLPPVRSRTRENPAATASSRQPLGGNGGAVPQRRASSARRRTGSSRKDATHKAAAAEATASAARTRVAWVNVVDGVPEPPSPPEAQAARRQGGRVLTRVPGMEASRGKENATQGQGTQRGVFLRRDARTEPERSSRVEAGGNRGKSVPHLTTQQRGVGAERECTRMGNRGGTGTSNHPARYGRLRKEDFGPGYRPVASGTQAPRDSGRREAWRENGDGSDRDGLAWMEHEERDRGREEEKESCSDGEHPDRSNDRGEGGPEVDVEANEQGNTVNQVVGSSAEELVSRRTFAGKENGWRGQPETVAVQELHGAVPTSGSGGFSAVDDRLPAMLETLDRVARTVYHLRGRCDRLAETADTREDRLRTATRRIDETRDRQADLNGPDQAPEQHPPRAEQRVTESVPSSVPVPLSRPPPHRQHQPEQVAMRPKITVPTPVTLPPRQPPPLLRPASPHELAPPSSSSPAISLGFSAAEEGGGGRTFVPPAGLFPPSPGVSLDRDGSPPWREVAAHANTSSLTVTAPGQGHIRAPRSGHSPTAGDEEQEGPVVSGTILAPARASTPTEDDGMGSGTRRRPPYPCAERSEVGVGDNGRASGVPSETVSDGRSQSELDEALEVFRNGVADGGRSVSSSLHRQGVDGERSLGRAVEVKERAPGCSTQRGHTGASGSSAMPSWSEWMTRDHGDNMETGQENRLLEQDGSGSEGGTYPTFSMAAVVAEKIAMNNSARQSRVVAGAQSSGTPFADLPQAEQQAQEEPPSPPSKPFSVIPSSWTTDRQRSRTSNNPDLWDSLLESGPTISPDRRLHVQGSRQPFTSTAVGQAASSEIEFESIGNHASGSNSRRTPASERESDSGSVANTGGDGDIDEDKQEEDGESIRAELEANAECGATMGREREFERVAENRTAAAERQRLSPAELEAQLANELRLYEDLHDAELQVDGLMAAATVEEARQQAWRAELLLHREREQADSLVLQQQQVFEDTLARNDAAHDARLRRERAVAEEQAARRAEAVTSSVSAAVALSLSAQSQQAAAAVAVVAAAEASIMSEMQSHTAALQHEEAQESDSDIEFEQLGVVLAAPRDDEWDDRRSATARADECPKRKPRRARNDFDSLLEQSPLPNRDQTLHTTPPSARARARSNHVRSGFWLSSPDDGSKSRATFKSDPHQSRCGDVARRSSNSGLSASGPIRVGSAGVRHFGAGEPSPGRLRHSYDGFSTTTSGAAARRQRSQSWGPQNGTGRAGNRAGEGVGCQAQQEFRRNSGSVGGVAASRASASWGGGNGGGGVSAKGGASMEYAAVRREIEREREAMSRRTQQQLRQLEAEKDSRKGHGAEGTHYADEEYQGVSEVEESSDEDARYSSFGSSGSESTDESIISGPRRGQTSTDAQSFIVAAPPSPGLPVDDYVDENGDDEREHLEGDGGEGEGSLYLADSLAQELQEVVAPVAASSRPSNMEAAETGDVNDDEESRIVSEILSEDGSGVVDDGSAIFAKVEVGGNDESLVESLTAPTEEVRRFDIEDEEIVEDGVQEVSTNDDDRAVNPQREIFAEVVGVLGGEDPLSSVDIEEGRGSGRDGDDEGDSRGYDSESFEIDAGGLEIYAGGDVRADARASLAELYSPLVTPPRAADDNETSRSCEDAGSGRRVNGNNAYSKVWGKGSPSRSQIEETSAPHDASPTVASPAASREKSTPQPPIEELDLEEGQKELDRLLLKAAVARFSASVPQPATVGGVRDAQGVTFQSRTDSESKRDHSRAVEGQKHGHARIDSGHEAEITSTPARDPRPDARVGSKSMVAATAELPQDLLLCEHYTEIEPAKPPTLLDWIAFGAAEARRALSSIPEASTQGGRPSASEHSHGERKDARVELDDDSFCSREGDESAGGDSEAELTALVAKIAVRGAESRSALIVQAVARGRRARRMAAAARGQRAAEEVAQKGKTTAAGAAATAESVTSSDDRAWETPHQGGLDSAIRDMEWWTRRAKGEGLSDSFDSSEVAKDVSDTPEWLMTAESESDLVENTPNQLIDSCRDEGSYGGGLDELASPRSGKCSVGHVEPNLTVAALEEYDLVEPALSPAGMDADLSLDPGGRTDEEGFAAELDYIEATVLVSATATAERGGRADHANVSTDRWEDDSSPLALESPTEEGPASAAVADDEEMRASRLPGQESRLAESEDRERSESLKVLHHRIDLSVVRQEERTDSGDVDLVVPAALPERDGFTQDPRDGHGKETDLSCGDFAEEVEDEEEESYYSESFEVEDSQQDSAAGESNEHVEATGVTGEGEGRRVEGRLFPTTPVASLPDLSAYIGSDLASADEKRSLSSAPSWQRLVFDEESPGAMQRNDAPPSPESIQPLVTPPASQEDDRGADENEMTVIGTGALPARYDHVDAAGSHAHDLLLPLSAEPRAAGGDRPGALPEDQDYVEDADPSEGATVPAAEENAMGDRRSVEDDAPVDHGNVFFDDLEGTVGERDSGVEERDRKRTPAATAGYGDDLEDEGMAATVKAAPPTAELGMTTTMAEIPPSLKYRSYDYVEAAAALAPDAGTTSKASVVVAGLPAELDDGIAGGDPAAVRGLLPAGKSNTTLRIVDERMYDYVEVAVARTNDNGISDAEEESPQPEGNDGYTDGATVDIHDTPSEYGEEGRAEDGNTADQAVMGHLGSAAAEPRTELGSVDDVEPLPEVGQQKPPPLPDRGESLKAEQQESSPDFQMKESNTDAVAEHAIPALLERSDLDEVSQPDELSCGNNIRRATSPSADVSVKTRSIDNRGGHDGEGRVAARQVVEESLTSEFAVQDGVDAHDSCSVENPARHPEAVVLGQSELTIIGRDERLVEGSTSGRRVDCNSSEAKLARGRIVDDVVEPGANAQDTRRTPPSQAPSVHQRQQTADDGRKSRMETRDDDSTRNLFTKNDRDAPIAETVTGKPNDDKERLVDSITDELMGDLIGKLLGSPSSEIPGAVMEQIDLSRRRHAADLFSEADTIEEERRFTWDSIDAEDCGGSPSSECRHSDWGVEEEQPPTPRREEEEEEWGKAQLTETIGNEGGIVIAGEEETEEGGDDGWDRTRVSPTFSNEGRMFTGTATAVATATASGAGVNEHSTMTLDQHREGVLATRIGEEGGWGEDAVMVETYGDGVRFSIGDTGNGENGVLKNTEKGVVASMAVRLLGEGDVPSADVEPVDNELRQDEYYFPPVPLARPKKPWAALAALASTENLGKTNPFSGYTCGATGEVSLGVRTGGVGAGSSADGVSLASVGETQAVDVGVIREEVEEVFEEAERTGDGAGAAMQMQMEMDPDDGQSFMHDLLMEYPEFPWWPVVAAAIEAALGSMSLDELNDRMAMHPPPEEPYIEELEEDTLEFPPPEETPLENEAVIPPWVIDKLFNASDEEVMAGIEEEGIPIPDRDSIDYARWSAFDAANEYLAEKRAERAPRRPSDPPAPDGKLLHRMPGFRHFSSMEHAILEVTEAILRQDGACLPGREPNPDFAEMLPLDNKPQAWVHHEDDMYFLKCKLSEEILEDLMGETVLECKVVFALRDQARHKWSKWLAGQLRGQEDYRRETEL